MRAYLSMTIVFSVILVAAVVLAIVIPTSFFFEEDCSLITGKVTRAYNNKSVDIRIELENYEAVFSIPPSAELNKLLKDDDIIEQKVSIYISKKEFEKLNEKPRRVISIRQLTDQKNNVLLTFDETNQKDRQTLMGNKIMFVSFAGCASLVCAHHTVRTKKQHIR